MGETWPVSSTSTLTGFDRIAGRRVILTVIALMVVVTGVSIWAQRSIGRETGNARAHVRALQVAEASSRRLRRRHDDRRAPPRRQPRVRAAEPRSSRRRACARARQALVAERRALALPAGKAPRCARSGARASASATALDRLSRSERAADRRHAGDVSTRSRATRGT